MGLGLLTAAVILAAAPAPHVALAPAADTLPTFSSEATRALVHRAQARHAADDPNDLRLDILGRRNASRSKDITLSSDFSRPWFVPRGLGDSVRIFGNDFPTRAALHPLAADGPEWYRYELTDSLALTTARLSQGDTSLTPKKPRRKPSMM